MEIKISGGRTWVYVRDGDFARAYSDGDKLLQLQLYDGGETVNICIPRDIAEKLASKILELQEELREEHRPKVVALVEGKCSKGGRNPPVPTSPRPPPPTGSGGASMGNR